MAQKHNPGRGYREEFRIIAGRWRRRKLHFPPLPGIRPSPDRVRETLFNWLGQDLSGALTLELYAGTGVLTLEARSRGAAVGDSYRLRSDLARVLSGLPGFPGGLKSAFPPPARVAHTRALFSARMRTSSAAPLRMENAAA